MAGVKNPCYSPRDDALMSEFAGSKILITGGLGFIGSTLARRLVGLGADLTLVDSLIPDYGGNLFNIEGLRDRVRVNISDVRDTYSMEYLVRGKDYLFNLAGQTSHLDSMINPGPDLEINCRAQLSVLEACRTCNPGIKVIFASTRQIYGRPSVLPVTETHPLNPVDINGINKMAAEKYHLLYSDIYGIRATALRLTNTIGARMRIKDARQTFAGLWVRQLLENKPIEVWGGKQLRDFTDVEDAVDAFLAVAANEAANGQVYNLGGSEVIKLEELAKRMIEMNGGGNYTLREFPADRRAIDIGDYYADFSKIRSELGWIPKRSLGETIEATLKYYRESISHYV
jgi:UDP-glucose 4-epimerase